MESSVAKPDRQKELGAFYTPAPMADKLTEWAIRKPGDRALDPSFGGLAFLDSAARRLSALGASPEAVADQLFGVDLDEDAFAAGAASRALGSDSLHLRIADFFDVEPQRDLPLCEAVVGNPPYVRYQGWSGERARALSESAGVPMTRLASTWAPFVVHSTSFVAPGGRLAMVLPAEMLHAQYATDVVAFLERSYSRLRLAVFDERVFPGALEEVVLLLAEGRGEGEAAGLELVECRTLDDFNSDEFAHPAEVPARPQTLGLGRSKLLAQLLAADGHDVYERLRSDPSVHTLGQIASVDIGAVTGANDLFLLSEKASAELPPELTALCVSKASHIRGARLTSDDIDDLQVGGARLQLFTADRGSTREDLPPAAQELVAKGEATKLHERYKCRVRSPWWAVPVPGENPPDLFLTYFANTHPRLVRNDVGARHTNTVHAVRLHAEAPTASALAAGFVNSLTLLSAELVGRSYGGGVLKLEPTEAEAVLIPPVDSLDEQILDLVDSLLRAGDVDAVLDITDPLVLGAGLGASEDDIRALRTGTEKLRARRKARGRGVARA